MPMIRLQQGEDWQERFAKEYGNRRRIGFLPGLIIGMAITSCGIWYVVPWVASLPLGSLFSFTVGG